MRVPSKISRPFHGLAREYAIRVPAINRWAIVSRPLRGLFELPFGEAAGE